MYSRCLQQALNSRSAPGVTDAVLDSVKLAGLASEIARLDARFVIKDADESLRGAT